MRIINRTAIDKKNFEGFDRIIKAEFIENEFLIIIFSHKYLIYKLIQGDNTLTCEFVNNVKCESRNVFSYHNMLVFQNENSLAFYKMNRNNNDFKMVQSIEFDTEYSMEIMEMYKDVILKSI